MSRLGKLDFQLSREELYGKADFEFRDSIIEAAAQGVVGVLDDDAQLHMQAAANSSAQFVDSPDLDSAVVAAMLEANDDQGRIVDAVLETPGLRREFVRFIGELFYENARQRREAARGADIPTIGVDRPA